ncbi:MAG: phosphodiester glycosidase family protein [Muribaculaceae bacterium]|nr:phosphodiester glycosidase family protein [Muribaculaceae bacterium]
MKIILKRIMLGVFLAGTSGVAVTAGAESIDIKGKDYEITYISDRDLGPGIHYTRFRLAEYPLNVHIVKIDMTNPYNRIETTQANDKLYGTERLVAAAERQSSPGHEAVAGNNANFWCVSNQAPFSDYLIGSTYNGNMRNGKIITETNMKYDQWDHGWTHTGIVAVDADKNFRVGSYPFYSILSSDKTGNLEITQYNKVCRNEELALYNSYYPDNRQFLPVDQIDKHFVIQEGVSTEVYLKLEEGQTWRSAEPISFVVTEVKPDAGRGLRGNADAVLLGRGSFATALNKLAEGDKVTVEYGWKDAVDGQPMKLENLVGGNCTVMKDGELLSGNTTEAYNSQVYSRCAYGSDATGKTMYSIVIDKAGDNYGSSSGCPTDVMCYIMKHFGCVNLVNMDAGGSAEIYVEGAIANRTTEGTPRAVANGMLYYSIAPVDNEVARLEFFDYNLECPVAASYQPRVVAFNKYGAIIDRDYKGFTLSCDPSLGSCDGMRFQASGKPASGNLTASVGNVSVSKKMVVENAEMTISSKNILIDGTRKYPIGVTAELNGTLYNYDSTLMEWSVEDSEVARIDDGVLSGVAEGTTCISCKISEYSDNSTVKVEIAPEPEMHHTDWNTWAATGSSGISKVTVSEDGLVKFTYGSGARSPYMKLTKSVTFYSLPDEVLFSFTPSVNVSSINVDLRTALHTRTNRVDINPEDEAFMAGQTYTVKIPLSAAGDPEDVLNYPYSLHYIQFNVPVDNSYKGEQNIRLNDLFARYENNQAGVDRVMADRTGDSGVTARVIADGGVIEISADCEIKGVELYSVTGVKVVSLAASGTQVKTDIPGLSGGMYILNVRTAVGSAVKKLIIR